MITKMNTENVFTELDVDNVYIYVSDALRWDSLHPKVAQSGTVIKSVAASTHSPSSFASLLTGLYPPNHGVQSFRHQLQSSTSKILDIPNYDTRFLNSIFAHAERKHSTPADPIYSVLNTESPQSTDPFTNLEEPFCIIERGPGGHAPYGGFDGTAGEYFRQKGAANIQKIRNDYAQSVELDADLFSNRLEKLRENNLTGDTLVIFTSDHGELLGEGGELGHTSPMRPELVYVPTVFIHPILPSTEIEDSIFHHVDLFPTVADILNVESEFSGSVDGHSGLERISNDPRPCFYNNAVLPDWTPLISGQLHYNGVWDATGGYVNVESQLSDRLAVLGGKALLSSRRKFILRNLSDAFNAYFDGNTITYGSPSFSADDVDSILAHTANSPTHEQRTELSEAAEQQLRDLGYK